MAVSVGIISPSADDDIGRLLQRLLEQRLNTVELHEIILIVTTDTASLLKTIHEQMRFDPRIHLLTQYKGEGHDSAVNLFIAEAYSNTLLLCPPDTLPDYEAVEQLSKPLFDPTVGLAIGREPFTKPITHFTHFAVQFLADWQHVLNSQGNFSHGRLLAFRPLFGRIPLQTQTAVDGQTIATLLREKGGTVHYAPKAAAHRQPPNSLKQLLLQRRQFHTAQREAQHNFGRNFIRASHRQFFRFWLQNIRWHPKQFGWWMGLFMIETIGRLLSKWSRRD